MNILVIGNGFDLAHGLKTTYKDFLEFIQSFKKNKKIIENATVAMEFDQLISKNLWVNYFTEIYKDMIAKGSVGWIDFEHIISQIVQEMEKVRKNLDSNKKESMIQKDSFKIIRPFISKKTVPLNGDSLKYTVQAFDSEKERILDDLDKLTRSLEIYLTEIVEDENCYIRLPDIEGLGIDHVLSFNYTNTYEKLYDNDKSQNIEYDYIHGKADKCHNIKTCNLVLGVEEYLDDEHKDIDVEYIQFKKFYQRIFKKTGCQYKGWIEDATRFSTLESEINIYILGHSLDITDKDVLCDLFNIERCITTIFYHDEKTLGQQIANMVKLIGQDRLIKGVYGNKASIIFKKQQSCIKIN